MMGSKQNKNKNPVVEPIDATKYLDLNTFWLISQDENSEVPMKIMQLALSTPIEILQKYYRDKQIANLPNKIEFMNKALTNIVK